MFKDLTTDQKELAEFMCSISEKAYNAGWILGLEYTLWTSLHYNNYKYGHYTITSIDVNRLKELSSKCGGWIYFDENKEELFINQSEWQELYNRNNEKYI